jgi:RND superfamily putative drug exporter
VGTFARWCLRHRKLVVGSWLGVLVGLVLVANAVGNSYSNDFQLPSTESTRAINLLKQSFPAQSGETDQIVVHVTHGTVDDPAVRRRLTGVFTRVARLPHVASLASFYDPAGAGQVSRDGRTAFATLALDKFGGELNKATIQRIIDVAETARAPGLEVELGGTAIQQTEQAGFGRSALIGLVVAAVVLFVAFGSVLAMALPMASAIVAIGSGLSMIVLLTHVLRIANFAPDLAALIGLGVGIDYALFIVTRFRQNIQSGMETEDAVTSAVNTSGRAVLFAGLTVCISVLGMFALGISFLYGLAVSAAIAVAVTMLAALTFLPALLGMLGKHTLSRREQRRLAAEGPHEPELSGVWGRWSRYVQRHRWVALVLSVGVLLALAIPFFGLRLGSTDAGNDPANTTTRKAYDLLASGFGPGFNGPFQIAIDTTHAPDPRTTVDHLTSAIRATPDVAAVQPAVFSPNGKAAVITVFPETAPQDKATTTLLDHLRSDVIPGATVHSGLTVYVGGITAIFADFAHVISHKLPQFVGIVVLLSFLLLMTLFRSLLLPVKAALLNLLSIGAAFGFVVAIFQWGWGASLIGVDRTGPIESFVPVMMFAILFGLSMDYEVFLVSRIHEEWVRTNDNTAAVTRGLAATGRVITAAAAIMVVIFASFALGNEITVKLFGISFATAVFLDAFIIRSVLVPAFMQIMGKANWWLPGWLERALPDVHLEAEDVAAAPEPVTAG